MRWPLVEVVALFVVSRVLVVAVAAIGLAFIPLSQPYTEQFSPFHAPGIVGVLSGWDGGWYLDIAQHGYRVGPDYSNVHFFPLWPSIMWIFEQIHPYSLVAEIVVVHVLSLLAVMLLFFYAKTMCDTRCAVIACSLLCFFPSAYVLSMTYAEPLFAVLGLASLIAARQTRPRWSILFLALAILTRSQGIGLVPALVWANARGSPSRKSAILIVFATVLGAALALIGYLVYQSFASGDLLAPVTDYAMRQWDVHPAWPGYVFRFLGLKAEGRLEAVLYIDLVAYLVGMVVVVGVWLVRLPRVGVTERLAVTGLGLLPLLRDNPTGMVRFTWILFPMYPILVGLLGAERTMKFLVPASAGLMAVLWLLAARGYYTP